MSYQIKITEKKNDGWSYTDELKSWKADEIGIYDSDLNLWKTALDTLFSDSALSKAFNEAKTIAEKKRVIWMAMQISLGFQLNDLKTDLERSIKIYPLRGKTKRAGE